MLSLAHLDHTFNRALGVALSDDQKPNTCPQQDPDALFKTLIGIKVLGQQVISNEDARGIADSLVATVRCNAFAEAEKGAQRGARQILIPVIAIASAAAVIAVFSAVVAKRGAQSGRSRGYAGHHQKRGRGSEPEPPWNLSAERSPVRSRRRA